MKKQDVEWLKNMMKGTEVERPNKASSGTLSGHAAGEPFEKKVYQLLKRRYPKYVFKQFEFLNDLYLRNPRVVTLDDRNRLFSSPTALFLLSRGERATREWSPQNIFEEKQNDTADMLLCRNGSYNLIDVKTRNVSKNAQPPNIISSYKLAKACAYMLDNEDYDSIDISYVEIDWVENGNSLRCVNMHYADLFATIPTTLYINWSAAMQLQFHVCDLDQSWRGSKKEWASAYIKVFVDSAKHHISSMKAKYITPFLKYIS